MKYYFFHLNNILNFFIKKKINFSIYLFFIYFKLALYYNFI